MVPGGTARESGRVTRQARQSHKYAVHSHYPAGRPPSQGWPATAASQRPAPPSQPAHPAGCRRHLTAGSAHLKRRAQQLLPHKLGEVGYRAAGVAQRGAAAAPPQRVEQAHKGQGLTIILSAGLCARVCVCRGGGGGGRGSVEAGLGRCGEAHSNEAG